MKPFNRGNPTDASITKRKKVRVGRHGRGQAAEICDLVGVPAFVEDSGQHSNDPPVEIPCASIT